MFINDLFSDKTPAVTEAAMNPTAYKQSVDQAERQGVLVGFEFEVCIPKSTMRQPAPAEPAIEPHPITAEWVAEIIRNTPGIISNWGLDHLNSYFTPRSDVATRYPGFRAAADGLQQHAREWILDFIKNTLAPEESARWLRLTKNNVARHIRNSGSRFVTPEERQRRIESGLIERWRKWYFDQRSPGGAYDSVQPDQQLSNIFHWAWGSVDDAQAINAMFVDTDYQDVIADWNRYFDYDPRAAYDGLRLNRHDPTRPPPPSPISQGRVTYSEAAEFIKPHVEQVTGANVKVFSSYHQQPKNMTSWYIEPDGSLHPNPGDAAVEIVGPPEPPIKALDSLKNFFAMSERLGLYTSRLNYTGLHINVSIPESLDVLKLAVMLGDQHVIKSFGRENNSYVRSIMKRLQAKVDPTRDPSFKVDLRKLQQLAREISIDHFSSISYNGHYVSFRHAGGDYLSDHTAIVNVVGRFVRAMVIAADPTAYRQEYLKAVARLLQPKTSQELQYGADGSPWPAYIRQTSQTGLWCVTTYAYMRPEIKTNPTRADWEAEFAHLRDIPGTVHLANINVVVETSSAKAKKCLTDYTRPGGRARGEVTGQRTGDSSETSAHHGAVEQFATIVYYPAGADLRPVPMSPTGVDLFRVDNRSIPIGYARTVAKIIPPSDPQVRQYLTRLQYLLRRIPGALT